MSRPHIGSLDPLRLHLPPSRNSGADPVKLQRQLALFGTSAIGMPLIEVSLGSDGEYMINNGVTRATRVAKLLPGVTIQAEVIDILPYPVSRLATVGDKLP